MEPIVNRVAESEIEVFNLEELWDGREVVEFDIAPFLDQGLVLREKDFRKSMAEHDWSAYQGRHVAVHCSTDAILPVWATMLVASKLRDHAASVSFGRTDELVRDRFVEALSAFDWSAYTDKMVVIKGCASKVVPQNAYLLATGRLQDVARKVMFGEPCSSVPLWRKRKDAAEASAKSAKR